MAKKQDGSSKKTKTAPRATSKAAKPNGTAPASGTLFEDTKHAAKPAAKPAAPKQQSLSVDAIGETAGDVWRILSEKNGQTLAALMKAVEASDDQVLLALGWLAREDKLAFETNGRTVTVSLK